MAAKAGAAASFMFVLFLLNIACHAQLSPAFYDSSCPNALSAIRTSIRSAIASDRRMAASLIRLHFHDCFVQGCDASILLDETSSIQSEKSALGNLNSARGYNVIDKAKTEVEKICPGVVSCADIIAVAARDASAYVGGPSYAVKLGRRDSTTASRTLANAELPAFFESLESLISRFQKKGLTARDMVALSGSHTLGQAQCFTFRERIYNHSNIDTGFASTRRRRCPRVGSDSTLVPLDLVTPILSTTITSRI
ncbi:lignin-forming anionic peroxidase-like [Populus alba x Populus x berolinensis]|nr:lignin-forming anionic peroxidase-like [Populus alba x Populus x berolinensis]